MPLRHRYVALFLLLAGLHVQAQEEPPADDAAAPPAAQERAPLEERSQATATALTQQVETAEQQQLQTPDETFLALWLPANVGKPSGVVIIVPGDSESADWPNTVGPLRQKLPNAGWHSLSLMLPDPNQPYLPPRTSAAVADTPAPAGEPAPAAETPPAQEPAAGEDAGADTAATDASEAAPAPVSDDPETQRKNHAARIAARIDAGIAFAIQQQATSIVLLGHGSGAYWAAQYLAEHPAAPVKNLLLVAAELPAGYGPALDELIPGLKLATGDFYYKDQLADRQAALKRMHASKRHQHPAYVQIAMKALPGNPPAEQEQLYRRIRGWLTQHLQPAR
ncbi:alpha/beta hydrolase family protein [Pseudomonas borbori]